MGSIMPKVGMPTDDKPKDEEARGVEGGLAKELFPELTGYFEAADALARADGRTPSLAGTGWSVLVQSYLPRATDMATREVDLASLQNWTTEGKPGQVVTGEMRSYLKVAYNMLSGHAGSGAGSSS